MIHNFQEDEKQKASQKDISSHQDREITLEEGGEAPVPHSNAKIVSLLERAKSRGPDSFYSTVQQLHRSVGNQRMQTILDNHPSLFSSPSSPSISRSPLAPEKESNDNVLSLQNEDQQQDQEEVNEGEQQDEGVNFSLTAGTYTEVSLTVHIPVATGVTVDITLAGKYAEFEEGGNSFIEAEGTLRVSLTADILFLSVSAFVDGTVKMKIKNESDWQTALRRGFEDISRWFVARELADLEGMKDDIRDHYWDFEDEVGSLIDDQLDEDNDERMDEISQQERHWYGDNAIANIIDARNELVEDIQDMFSDHDAYVSPSRVFPGTTWFFDKINPIASDGRISNSELRSLKWDIIRESIRRRGRVTGRIDQLPATDNDEDVEFEITGRIGLGASAEITGSTSASVEVAAGLRFGDAMDDSTFNTEMTDAYFASLAISTEIGDYALQGEVKYESEGSPLPSQASKWKLTAKGLVGIAGEVNEPDNSTVESVGARIGRAIKGSRIGGADAAGVMAAARTSLARELRQYMAQQAAEPPEFGFQNLSGQQMVGVEVEVEFDSEGNLSKGHVKFMYIHGGNLDMGIFEGSASQGVFIGTTFSL